MSAEEVKTTNGNADAAKDVQDLLAELKEGAEKTETENPVEEDEAAKEARIIAEANKLGKNQRERESQRSAPDVTTARTSSLISLLKR